DYVSTSYQEALNLNLSGTPSIILNGRLLPGDGIPFDYTVWDNFVQQQIQVQESLKDLSQYDAPPPMTIDENATYLAHVKMENGGEFVIELFPKSAPQTVNSFVFLANEGWFNGVTFHRVIKGFVAQTGDPSGTGMGGPGYTIPNEIDPNLSQNEPGMVAMANSGPDTNGSQWYITLGDVSQLDGRYTIFGRVIEGMDVVEAITPRNPENDPNAPPGDVISSITIEVTGN
ncbi:MAG: peptidylprolyl isomerase, partial [Anaerolineae bacterium]